MHLFDAEARFMGGYAIVGGQLRWRRGQGSPSPTRAWTRSSSARWATPTNIGAWHESLNIAQLWKLPGHLPDRQQPVRDGDQRREGLGGPELYKKACAFDMRAERVDGNDVLAVRDATLRAVDLARKEKLPTVLEAVSFRIAATRWSIPTGTARATSWSRVRR